MRPLALLLAVIAAPVWGQTALTLEDAVKLALKQHPAIEASDAQVKAAATKIDQARAGYLPKLNYSESWQRSNNPVFVFSSLLTQHQFTENNFAVGPLNRPEAMNNFQSRISVEQPIYDAGMTRKAKHAAELGRDMATEQSRRTSMDVVAGVARTYYGAVLAAEALKVAEEARKSAEADLARAETIRAAGMATDADVLSIRVHLASVREQLIRRTNDVELSRAALNDALGVPLSQRYDLTTPLAAVPLSAIPLEEYSKRGLIERPELRQARLAAQIGETQTSLARSALLPMVVFQAAFEADRQRFVDRGGANWISAVGMRWNLFNGGEDKARIEEARQQTRQARAIARRGESAVRLQVESAYLDWKAAQERIEVAGAAVAAAQESLRITQNRYSNGLATVTDLLRTETALLETRTRRLAAVHDQRVAAAMLELAAGTLNAASDVLK
jgi:outer membrane protein TolC